METKKVTTLASKKTTGTNGNGSQENGKNNHRLADKLFNNSELDKKIKLVRERAGNAVMLGLEKAVAHYENPSMYPIPSDNKTVEKAFHDLLAVLPNSKRKKMVDKINETLKASPAERTNKYKEIVNVNFKSSVPIVQQVNAMPVPDTMKFTKEEGTVMAEEYKRKAEKPKNTGYATSSKPQPQQAASASRISFFVDNMTCLNPDDVRKDEINLAGFSIDSTGNNVQLSPFFVGKFRKDETVLLSGKEKLFTLNIDPAQLAQSFIAGLFIIESDLVSNQDLVNKITILFAAVGAALYLISVGILIAGLLGAAVTVTALAIFFIGGLGFSIISQFSTLIGDDISLAVTDTLAIADKVDIGETFSRTLTIGKGFDAISTFDGKYTAAARWVGEA